MLWCIWFTRTPYLLKREEIYCIGCTLGGVVVVLCNDDWRGRDRGDLLDVSQSEVPGFREYVMKKVPCSTQLLIDTIKKYFEISYLKHVYDVLIFFQLPPMRKRG